MTVTLLSTVKMVGGIASGREHPSEQALDELAAQWPNGVSIILRQIGGAAPAKTAAQIRGPAFLTTVIYSLIFWLMVYAGLHYFTH